MRVQLQPQSAGVVTTIQERLALSTPSEVLNILVSLYGTTLLHQLAGMAPAIQPQSTAIHQKQPQLHQNHPRNSPGELPELDTRSDYRDSAIARLAQALPTEF